MLGLQTLGVAVAVGVLRPGGMLGDEVQSGRGGPVRIHWNPDERRWPDRPAGSPSAVIFVSTGDPEALKPPDFNLEMGDVWRRDVSSEMLIEPVLPR